MKNGGRGSASNEFTSTDSCYIFAKEKEFRSEDAINVSADAEDATERCNPGNSNLNKPCRVEVFAGQNSDYRPNDIRSIISILTGKYFDSTRFV